MRCAQPADQETAISHLAAQARLAASQPEKPKFAWEAAGAATGGDDGDESDEDDSDDEMTDQELPPGLESTRGLVPLPAWEASRPATSPARIRGAKNGTDPSPIVPA